MRYEGKKYVGSLRAISSRAGDYLQYTPLHVDFRTSSYVFV